MKKLRITVGKKTYDVTVEVLSDDDASRARPGVAPTAASSAPAPAAPGAAAPTGAAQAPAPAGAVTSPMAGVVKSVLVKAGDRVEAGQRLLTLDAMKMEVPVAAPLAGTVERVDAQEGQSVSEGQVLVVLS